MGIIDKLSLLFRPGERAFRRALDEIDPYSFEDFENPKPGDIFQDENGKYHVLDRNGEFLPFESEADNPPTLEKK
jgi:hypothetical protein